MTDSEGGGARSSLGVSLSRDLAPPSLELRLVPTTPMVDTQIHHEFPVVLVERLCELRLSTYHLL